MLELVLWCTLFLSVSVAQSTNNETCPTVEVFVGVQPAGSSSSMTITKIGSLTLEDCIIRCCEKTSCNAALILANVCHMVTCNTDEACDPVPGNGTREASFKMASLRWHNGTIKRRNSDISEASDHLPGTHMFLVKHCEVGIVVDCGVNEECESVNKRSRNGLCRCKNNYTRDGLGVCQPKVDPDAPPSTPPPPHVTSRSNTSVPVDNATSSTIAPTPTPQPVPYTTKGPPTRTPKKKLEVSTINKTVQLPENSADLTVYVIPPASKDHPYSYKWTLVTQPPGEDTGQMGSTTSDTMTLTNLLQGNYTFKVEVYDEDSYGSDLANVSVLPPKRINKPPVAIIKPPNQIIQLPSNKAILDGGSSTDDDEIISYKWEMVEFPIDYHTDIPGSLPPTSTTIQLEELIAGNYTFRLTVEDSDHAKNSTVANVTVLKERDYPPTANAGQDVIIYLPQTTVTLNGNLSTDDKGIQSWQWTKSPGSEGKAVDMQDTHSSVLTLSNLEEGVYTFTLKVTDTAGASSQDDVNVFVKPQQNRPPVAEAGPEQSISLPTKSVELDGSNSRDDQGIVTWQWKQIRGPIPAHIVNATSPKTMVEGLTRGVYVFQLTVSDNSTQSSDNVTITVTQDKNTPPVADAGGDKTIHLPASIIYINGSRSSDDIAITRWLWTREPNSLAAGTIFGDSDKTSVLQIGNLSPGHYLFRLTVWDEENSTGDDTVSLIVKPDEREKDYVELELNADIKMFTEDQKNTLMKKLALLLHQDGEKRINIVSVTGDQHSGRVTIVFTAEQNKDDEEWKMIPGKVVVKGLKESVRRDDRLLDFAVLKLQTVICQNDCSGHGSCEHATRDCACQAFWVENVFRKYFGDGESNCDWSILYVVLCFVCGVILVAILAWVAVCLWRRRTHRPKTTVKRRQRYSLLNNREHMELLPKTKEKSSGTILLSDSDTDSDVLFETRRKSSTKLQINGLVNEQNLLS